PERVAIVERFNATEQPYDRSACVHRLVADAVRRHPDQVALRCDDVDLTYRELDARASSLALRLRERGVGEETLVGVCLEPSIELVVALYAIWKAGGAYLPLEPSMPAQRLASMVEDASPVCIVTRGELTGRLPLAPLVLLDGAPAVDERALEGRVLSSNLGYVLFTSGSTGRPKGIAIEHRSIVNLLGALGPCLWLGPGRTLLSSTTIAFDIAGLELWLQLTTGATVVIASRRQAGDGFLLGQALP